MREPHLGLVRLELDHDSGCEIHYASFPSPPDNDHASEDSAQGPEGAVISLADFSNSAGSDSPADPSVGSLADELPVPDNPIETALENVYGDTVRTVLTAVESYADANQLQQASYARIIRETGGLLISLVDQTVTYDETGQPSSIMLPHNLEYFARRSPVFNQAAATLIDQGHENVCGYILEFLFRISTYQKLPSSSLPNTELQFPADFNSDADPPILRILPGIADD
jgi:hypothetical protein